MANWTTVGHMTDHSDLAHGSIGVQTGSMAGTNTVSVQPDFGAPGSDSESVVPSDIRSAPDDVGTATNDYRRLERGGTDSAPAGESHGWGLRG